MATLTVQSKVITISAAQMATLWSNPIMAIAGVHNKTIIPLLSQWSLAGPSYNIGPVLQYASDNPGSSGGGPVLGAWAPHGGVWGQDSISLSVLEDPLWQGNAPISHVGDGLVIAAFGQGNPTGGSGVFTVTIIYTEV